MQKQQIPLKNSLFLLLAAIIWGIAFVAQSVGMEYVGGFTYSAVRSLLGSVVLIPLILISGRKNSADTAATKANSFVGSSDGTVSSIRKRKDLIIGGISCGILSGIPALLFEHPEFSAICRAWMPILYAGIMSCGVAYTLQIIGQKNMNPTVASLILSLESCISVLAGWVLLGQQLSAKEILGCVIMFAAIILAQLPQKQAE